MTRQRHPGYRPLEEFEVIESSDWFEGFSGALMIMNGNGRIPEFARVISVPAWLVGSFWRHSLTEDRRIGCSHPQDPDDTIPGDWLKDLPCPVPSCPAGQHGGSWDVNIPPPKISLAMTLNGGPLGEYRKITYVSEPSWVKHGRGPVQRHFRWKLEL